MSQTPSPFPAAVASEAIAPPPLPIDVDIPPHPLYLAARRTGEWIETAVTTGLLLIAGIVITQWNSGWSAWAVWGAAAWACFAGLLGGYAQWWPPVAIRRMAFRVSASAIEIRRGVYWRTVITVPRNRVQHVDVNQGPIERRYGLAHVVIHTAGMIGATSKLDGVDHATALAIRDFLIKAAADDAV